MVRLLKLNKPNASAKMAAKPNMLLFMSAPVVNKYIQINVTINMEIQNKEGLDYYFLLILLIFICFAEII